MDCAVCDSILFVKEGVGKVVGEMCGEEQRSGEEREGLHLEQAGEDDVGQGGQRRQHNHQPSDRPVVPESLFRLAVLHVNKIQEGFHVVHHIVDQLVHIVASQNYQQSVTIRKCL